MSNVIDLLEYLQTHAHVRPFVFTERWTNPKFPNRTKIRLASVSKQSVQAEVAYLTEVVDQGGGIATFETFKEDGVYKAIGEIEVFPDV